MRFKDKVVIITGASRGIGKATALEFAKEGANVVVDYNVSEIEPSAESNAYAVVKEINEIGSQAIAVSCDVSNENEVQELIRKAIVKFNKIDILVNNAGIVFDTPFFKRTIKQWKTTLDTNLFGTFLCSKYVASGMLRQKSGKIINISSTNGINYFDPESIDYDASKAGIINLTKNLAKELAPSVQVNSIAPGWVDTKMNEDLPQEFIDQETEQIYLKRFANPEEIARVVLFLASDDANYITGSTLKVDGGHA